ncbi:uncharacterized protein LOC136079487 [Hydra vulgaris]|uniref:Uncharacterized protein LOC136079487 n=1 Tax=Hydra vulgaris TaxID=6087 RepID=A0ABM4BQ84_HYDVU
MPDQWKSTHLTPIPKIANPHSMEDYRPIAITSALCKIFNQEVKTKMTEQLEGAEGLFICISSSLFMVYINRLAASDLNRQVELSKDLDFVDLKTSFEALNMF